MSFFDASYLIPPATIIVVIWIILFYQTGKYDLTEKISILSLLMKILKSVTICTVVLMIVAFLSRSENYSRSLIVMLWAISFLILIIMNILSFKVQRWFKNLKVGVENIGIMGYTSQSRDLVKKIMNIPRMPYHFCGYILSKGQEMSAKELIRQDDNIIGYTDEIPAIINKYSLDRIIICSASVRKEETLLLARTCEKMGVHLNIVPDIINFISNRIILTDIDNIPLIEIKRPGFTRWDFGVKRVFDLSAILVLGAVLFPLLCLIVVLTKLDSRGPIFMFKNELAKAVNIFLCINSDRCQQMLTGREKGLKALMRQMDIYSK